MQIVFFTCFLLLISLCKVTCKHADCARVRRIDPFFNDADLDSEHTFQNFHNLSGFSSPLPWPDDYSTPITFTLKTEQEIPDAQVKAIVQISLTKVDPMFPNLRDVFGEFVDANNATMLFGQSGELLRALEDKALFNCFVDRDAENHCSAGALNPRCCYHPDAGPDELRIAYPQCENDCRSYGPGTTESSSGSALIKSPCRVVCMSALVIQVEFGLNRNGTGGETIISAVYKRTRLSQTLESDYEFTDLDSADDKPIYAKGNHVDEGSALNGKVETGYWIRWTPRRAALGPFLEVGRDAEASPYFVHDFTKHCFDCNSGDMYGWTQTDVQNPLMMGLFAPKFWYVNALADHGGVEAGFDCRNIIYSPYQDQQYLDGPCIFDSQCRDWCQTRSCLGRSCEIDSLHYTGDLQWLGITTCQIEATEEMPTYIVIILALVGLIGAVALLLMGMCLFYLGSIYPRKKRAAHVTVQAPQIKRIGDPVAMEEWEPQTLEEDQGAQVPATSTIKGIPVSVPAMNDLESKGGDFKSRIKPRTRLDSNDPRLGTWDNMQLQGRSVGAQREMSDPKSGGIPVTTSKGILSSRSRTTHTASRTKNRSSHPTVNTTTASSTTRKYSSSDTND